MKRFFIILIVLLFLETIMLVGCKETITEGIVHDMKYEPARTEIVLIPIFTNNGAIYIPTEQYIPDKYVITIRSKDVMPADYVFSEYEVTQEVFQRHRIGSYFRGDE